MVCPILEQASQQNIEAPTEYPYQTLYRPWSWALSTLSNLFLFAVVFLVSYALYRRRRKVLGSGGGSTVTYRRVDVNKPREERANVLVIGAQGSFGRHLVENLLSDGGYNVHCLDSYIPYPEDRCNSVCSYIQTDTCCYEDMLLCTRGMQAVFHAGSLTPHHLLDRNTDIYHTNITGTENVVRVCRECDVKRLIYTSSATVVVGKKWNRKLADESTPSPKKHSNVYWASLATAEQLVLNSNGKDGLVTCALRLAPFTCSVNDPFTKTLLSQSTFIMKSAGHGVTLGDADSSAKAHILADKKLCSGATSGIAGNAYNLGNNTRVLYCDFVGTLASDDATIWGHQPPTEISKPLLTFLAYVNYYWYKMTGTFIVNKNLSPPLLDSHTTELSFSSERARCDLGWEDEGRWQEIVTRLVQAYHTIQETKKEQ